jgi:hypothetical protein
MNAILICFVFPRYLNLVIFGFVSYHHTECNRIRYKTLKIYCDQTNGYHNTVSYRAFLNTSSFLQVLNMAAPGYAADIQTIF